MSYSRWLGAKHVRLCSRLCAKVNPMLIAQLSDPHLNPSRPHKARALKAAVAYLNALPMRPDAVVISGDLADNGQPEEYALLRELLAPFPMPVFVLPGNHDCREAVLNAFGEQGQSPLPGFVQYAVNLGALRLLALDTLIPEQGAGRLDEVRLRWLEERLNETPHTPTLVFLHHPPMMSGLQVMDSIGLEGTAALRQIISRHPQVERMLAGHTHMSQTTRFAGTLLMTCPGLDATFLPDLTQPQKLVVQMQPPQCLLHHWTPETGMNTYTSAISELSWETLHDGETWL